MGIPTACELLDTISPQFIADLVSWGAIGARSASLESPPGVVRESERGLTVLLCAQRPSRRSTASLVRPLLSLSRSHLSLTPRPTYSFGHVDAEYVALSPRGTPPRSPTLTRSDPLTVGFKNGTDGSLQIAIDAIGAAASSHSFLSVTKQGISASASASPFPALSTRTSS